MSQGTGPKVYIYPILLGILIFLGGCASNDEFPFDFGKTTTVPPPPRLQPTVRHGWFTPDSTVPREWLPPAMFEKSWTAIVIHHSGTDEGNMAIIDKWHREGRHWEGIGYDFVIGNNTGSGNGEVETTFRWTGQKVGAHCKTPDNWANENAVGICLIGDFNKRTPTGPQMMSLVKLVRFLQKRYNIPAGRIYGHGDTPGAIVSDCPGRHFSMARFKSML